MDVHEVVPQIRKGYRMGAPNGCPPEVYQLMLQCWAEAPKDRPDFAFLRAVLIELSGQPASAFDAEGGAQPPPSSRPSSAAMSVYLQPTPTGTLTGSMTPYKYDNPAFSSSYSEYENSADLMGAQVQYDNPPILGTPTYYSGGPLTAAMKGAQTQYDMGHADDGPDMANYGLADEPPRMEDYGLVDRPAAQGGSGGGGGGAVEESVYRMAGKADDGAAHGAAGDEDNVYHQASKSGGGGGGERSETASREAGYLDVGSDGSEEVTGF